jgi:hypothetical protein
MIFQVMVRFREIPDCWLSSKKFFAVSSGLLREIKPDTTALAPGASSRYKTSAAVPPSHGIEIRDLVV